MEKLMSLRRSMEQLRPARTQKLDLQEKVQSLLVEGPIKAEDYEAAIVIGWHKNNNKKYLCYNGIYAGGHTKPGQFLFYICENTDIDFFNKIP